MTLKEQLQADLAAAMRSGETEKRDTLRGLMAAIKQVEKDDGVTLDDAGILNVLNKQIKQRRETIADAERAGRPDMIAVAAAEIARIEQYLPRQLSPAEIETVVEAVIQQLGATDMKGMGQVMGRVMAQLKGQADGGLVSQIVREKLQGR